MHSLPYWISYPALTRTFLQLKMIKSKYISAINFVNGVNCEEEKRPIT